MANGVAFVQNANFHFSLDIYLNVNTGVDKEGLLAILVYPNGQAKRIFLVKIEGLSTFQVMILVKILKLSQSPVHLMTHN